MPRLIVKVLDSFYGYQVEEAHVTVKAIGSKFRKTRTVHAKVHEGAVFEDLAPGDYMITVSSSLPYIPYKDRITLSNEDKVIEVKLLRPIEVFVKDPEGNPIKNAIARVIAIVAFPDKPKLGIFYGPYEEVDEEGRVELLPAADTENIRVEVCAPGYDWVGMAIPFDLRDLEKSQNRLMLNVTLKPKSCRIKNI